MCFMAGANAVFTGDQMLTTPCVSSPYMIVLFTSILTAIVFFLSGSPWDEVSAIE